MGDIKLLSLKAHKVKFIGMSGYLAPIWSFTWALFMNLFGSREISISL